MEKLKQLHFNAINTTSSITYLGKEDFHLVANKCSEITKQIAIEFADWVVNCDNIWSTPKEELFQEFMKIKKQ